MLGLAEIFVLLVFFLIGVGGVTAILARASGLRRRRVEGEMAQVLEELAKVNDRLNGVDERLADLTLMVDEASRPALDDGRPSHD
ncbi:hypothetical protein CMK11_14880 [Candidatus Poribacteria bacterium]|nr:hypothetical protein [Candidatus Poribacteria bacterium]